KIVQAWTRPRTSDEIIELATLLRLPVAPIGNGAKVTSFEHFVARGTFVPSPDGAFVQPRAPWSMSDRQPRPFEPAPALGRDDGTVRWEPRTRRAPATDDDTAPRPLPLAGLRVVDFTAFW